MGDLKKARKLYEKLSCSQANVSFADLCALAEACKMVCVRQSGTSHKIYKLSSETMFLNFQNFHGKAKPYQVKQLIKFIEMYDLLNEGESHE